MQIGIVSGGLIVIAGLLVAIGINYYAVTVYQNFDGSMMRPDNGIHYIYGPCLIIGKSLRHLWLNEAKLKAGSGASCQN